MAKKNLLTSFLLSAAIASNAQQHNFNDSYVKPTDTLVQQKIEQWQDLSLVCLCIGAHIVNGVC